MLHKLVHIITTGIYKTKRILKPYKKELIYLNFKNSYVHRNISSLCHKHLLVTTVYGKPDKHTHVVCKTSSCVILTHVVKTPTTSMSKAKLNSDIFMHSTTYNSK